MDNIIRTAFKSVGVLILFSSQMIYAGEFTDKAGSFSFEISDPSTVTENFENDASGAPVFKGVTFAINGSEITLSKWTLSKQSACDHVKTESGSSTTGGPKLKPMTDKKSLAKRGFESGCEVVSSFDGATTVSYTLQKGDTFWSLGGQLKNKTEIQMLEKIMRSFKLK